jgi:hypothetical protein
MNVRIASFVFLASLFMLVACASPETGRTRGGGPGGDVGNRTKSVRMHEGANPFEKTPKLIPAKGPSLAGARQADERYRQ